MKLVLCKEIIITIAILISILITAKKSIHYKKDQLGTSNINPNLNNKFKEFQKDFINLWTAPGEKEKEPVLEKLNSKKQSNINYKAQSSHTLSTNTNTNLNTIATDYNNANNNKKKIEKIYNELISDSDPKLKDKIRTKMLNKEKTIESTRATSAKVKLIDNALLNNNNKTKEKIGSLINSIFNDSNTNKNANNVHHFNKRIDNNNKINEPGKRNPLILFNSNNISSSNNKINFINNSIDNVVKKNNKLEFNNLLNSFEVNKPKHNENKLTTTNFNSNLETEIFGVNNLYGKKGTNKRKE